MKCIDAMSVMSNVTCVAEQYLSCNVKSASLDHVPVDQDKNKY